MPLASRAINRDVMTGRAMGSLGSVLKAAVLAGLIAGAITAGLHTLQLEPLIERAIELEEQASQTHGQAAREPVIGRPTQRWGLVLGFPVYGALSLLPFLPGGLGRTRQG